MTIDLNAEYVAQIRAAGVLIDLLAIAAEQGLPRAAWMLTGGGHLVGHCLGATDVQRRASFEAWTDLVGARRFPDDIGPLWTVELRARAEDVRACRVDVVAWLDEPFGGEHDEDHGSCQGHGSSRPSLRLGGVAGVRRASGGDPMPSLWRVG